ncbi:hypothetical protein WMY93_000182 [Mugilogobius chulae]|uniref:Uncharacterized protein n=1 Tax=Mugilogobius chulae TaxID=88201 RepID=A0AAW0PYL6_9GOBI
MPLYPALDNMPNINLGINLDFGKADPPCTLHRRQFDMCRAVVTPQAGLSTGRTHQYSTSVRTGRTEHWKDTPILYFSQDRKDRALEGHTNTLLQSEQAGPSTGRTHQYSTSVRTGRIEHRKDTLILYFSQDTQDRAVEGHTNTLLQTGRTEHWKDTPILYFSQDRQDRAVEGHTNTLLQSVESQ